MYDVGVGYFPAVRGGQQCVLLGEKQRGLGEGKVVVPGGKLEAGESARDARVCELREKTGNEMPVDALKEVAVVNYTLPTKRSWSQCSRVLVADDVSSNPMNYDELRTWWCSMAEVPYERIWDDAKRWVPQALAGESRLDLDCTFGADLSTMVETKDPDNE